MKTKQIFIPLIAFSIFVLTACKKDTITEPDPAPPITLSTDSIYLYKIIDLDSTVTSTDTNYVTTYYYDNLKRVTKITDGQNSLSNQFVTTYNYNSNDTIPFKTTGIYLNLDTTITYHFYDNQLRKLKDSLINNPTATIPFITVHRYSYYNSGFAINSFTNNPGSLTLIASYRDSVSLDAIGNIIQYKEYRGPNIFTLQENVTISYDNKQSPFAKLSNFNARDLVIGGEPLSIDGFPQISNPIKYILNFSNNGTPTTTQQSRTSYEYKLNGLPKISRSLNNAGVAFGQKSVYLYRAN
jgi:hypothetical protein